MNEWTTRITQVQLPEKKDGGAALEACLVLIYPTGADMGRRFPLSGDEVVIGRGSDCSLQLDRDSVSRRHVRLRPGVSGWMVEDLGSTNGTYVNDKPVERGALADGDLLRVGGAIFKFLMGANVEVSYHEAIYRMTIIDGLTGVHNKRAFLECLDREIARCARYSRPLSLVMFDIDHFKMINDRFGHLTGDQVLRELAQRLHSRIRREEFIARYGGEEFAVVLPETGRVGALEFAEQIRLMIAREPFKGEGSEMTVTISLGVATMEGAAVDPTDFIRSADENLYRAKHEGRNRVVG